MNFDYEVFLQELKGKGAIPLIVLYGVPNAGGVDLNWFSTSAYDNGDSQLKTDANEAISAVARQVNE